MTRHIRLAAAILAACLIAPHPASALPRKKDRWIELESEHFTFYSNAGARATRRIADDLELLRRVLAELSRLQVISPVPTTVYVFDSKAAFTPYKFLRQGEPAEIAGYYTRWEHGNYIAIDVSSASSATEIVYHEYIHYFTHNNLPPLPTWLEEGLAEFYSTFDTDAKFVNLGKAIGRHVGWLKSSPPIPLAELLAAESALFDERAKQGSFYAQSWALVHYLMVGNPERRPQLIAYLELRGQNVAQEEAFSQAFRTDYQGLERELQGYLRQLLFKYHRYELQASYQGAGEARSLPRHEVLYRLGDLLAIQGEAVRPEAAEHFQAALELAPDYPPAVGGLGFVAERQGRNDEARELYARALELSGDDYLVLYRLASSLLEKDLVQAPECRELLRRCVVREPGFAPAWALLTYAQTLDDEPPDKTAIQVAERTLKMLPRRPDVARNLLLLYARSGDRAAAETLVDGYFAGHPDAEQRLEAEKVLIRMDLRQAYDLASGDRLEEASQIAGALADRTSDLRDLDQEIRRLQETIAAKRAAGRYNEALALFEAGQLAAAKTLLEELLADDSAPWQAESNRRLLQQIEKAQQGGAGAPRQRVPKSGTLVAPPKPADDGRRKEVDRLLARNRLAEAARLLEEMRGSSLDDAFWIDVKLKQVRSAQAHNRFVDRYNKAVDLVNAGSYGEAVSLLEELVAEAPNEQEAGDVRQLLERTREKLKR